MAKMVQPQRYVASVDCTQRNLEGKHVYVKAGEFYTPMGPGEEISDHLQPCDDHGNIIEVEFDILRPAKAAAEPDLLAVTAPAIDLDALKAELTAQIRAEILAELKAQTKAAAKAAVPAGTGHQDAGK